MIEDIIEKNLGLDQKVWDGIQSLLNNFVELEDKDNVVITYTPDSREPAAWVSLACQERGIIPKMVHMSPLRDPGFKERLSSVIPKQKSGEGRFILLMFERETMSHNQIVKSLLSVYDPLTYKVVRAINSGRNLFLTGLSIHPKELSALNATLLERSKAAKKLRIKTYKGTDLTVELDNSKFRYMSNRGIGQPGKFLVIPPGEVATFPANISGTLIADFAINVNMRLEKDVRLESNPITVEIENGKLKSYSCENSDIKDFLNKFFSRENTEFVGELGFGTNKAVNIAVSENSHLNERVPGVHLGFGQHNQNNDAAGYFCDIHLDICAKGGLVWFDDDEKPINLADLQPSENPHPQLVNCEDVFSDDAEDDCCGILTN